MTFSLTDFVRESNRIEGIHREPTDAEVEVHTWLCSAQTCSVESLTVFVRTVQPGAVLRDRLGLNVRVGSHYPPAGGPEIRHYLEELLADTTMSAFERHHAYETLHPFTDGNGRSGRALWLRDRGGDAPLGFLHHWYYQTLQAGCPATGPRSR